MTNLSPKSSISDTDIWIWFYKFHNDFFKIGHYIRKNYKLRSVCFTLGDALKKFFLFISSFSMSKQPEKPCGAWLFILFAFSWHPTLPAKMLLVNVFLKMPQKQILIYNIYLKFTLLNSQLNSHFILNRSGMLLETAISLQKRVPTSAW